MSGEKEGDKALAVRTLAQMGTAEDVALVGAQLDAADPMLRLWAAAAVIALSK